MRTWTNVALVLMLIFTLVAVVGCNERPDTSDSKQQEQQEQLLSEATKQVGMPAIKNFRERKMLKDILELRDQTGLTTYSYIFSEMQGKLIFLGETIGYPLPYSVQFTNPQKVEYYHRNGTLGNYVLPQADPNGLFSPQSAEGTWLLMKDPHGSAVRPVYVEPRVICSQFPLQ